MPDLDLWIETAPTIADDEYRALAAWNRIQDRPETVVFTRDGVDLPEQIVRVQVTSGSSNLMSETGKTGQQGVTVYGVRGHPSIDDTDMQRGDRFYLNHKWHVIEMIALVPGEVQGFGIIQEFGP